MLACYHTHTKRCGHASGEDEEYVLAAIKRGVRLLGFSDHAPMIFPHGYVSPVKMLPEQTGEYFSSLLALRERYADIIDIKIGFETEYFPAIWEESLDLWRAYPIDYLILGQHFISGEGYIPGEEFSGIETQSREKLVAYTDRVISAMGTGKISYVAHPDVLNFKGDEDFYRSEIVRLISAANDMSIPLEINLLGLSEGRSYPKEIFWREAGRLSAEAVIGCDAHSPNRVADPDEILSAKRFADKFGVNLLEEVTLRRVF